MSRPAAWKPPLNKLTCRAGRSRALVAPSVGEQVLLLAVGGEARYGVCAAQAFLLG